MMHPRVPPPNLAGRIEGLLILAGSPLVEHIPTARAIGALVLAAFAGLAVQALWQGNEAEKAMAVIGGFSLATLTALNYPLVKGGMPIVAPWTVGLITYETTMLGAVLATLVGLLVELGLPNFKNLPYDPSVVDGGIVLAVACPESSRASVERSLSAAGATKVNWV